MEKIKLVIWDLDETFWKGTLSEEGVEPIQGNIDLVRTLTDRGIMNSIVSKNDPDQAKAKLQEMGIWDYFIFPAIAWSPKGVLIKDIIEQSQLRDVNVLFLDDNHLNIEEARFYNKNLHAQFPDFIPEILGHKAFEGKDDKEHSRLKQYRILEDKAKIKDNYSSNEEFLRSSNIELSIIRELDGQVERVYELIERTNQLNFTKVRLTEKETEELVNNNEEYECALIHVKDNFGDYGLVGFYAVDKKSGKLTHFVFSCRILNLGVAQFVYAKLGFPKLDVIPEVAESLDDSSPDWITEVKGQIEQKAKVSTKGKLKIFFKGGCDLEQMLFYLRNNDFNVEDETNYVSQDNFSIHQEHTQVLLDAARFSKDQRDYVEKSAFIPFTDEKFYNTSVFDFNYDCLVYSVLMDYTQEVFSHKTKDLLLPFGGYYNYLTDTSIHETLVENYSKHGTANVTKEGLEEFSKNFTHIGQISPEKFIENLTEIRNKIPLAIPIVFINGAEIAFPGSSEKTAKERHLKMNAALDRFISESQNTALLDIRKFVTDKSQLTNGIRHYQREIYKDLSVEILNIINSKFNQNFKRKIGLKERLATSSPFLFKVAKKLKSALR